MTAQQELGQQLREDYRRAYRRKYEKRLARLAGLDDFALESGKSGEYYGQIRYKLRSSGGTLFPAPWPGIAFEFLVEFDRTEYSYGCRALFLARTTLAIILAAARQ